ncbi:hypothetical protein EB796_013687 [Bugula neritina]|uniref:SOCS5 n=1 Tax=Bugula neritina TaxID=10212 RepID=A0A7J7JNR4_BUGNE|nr:hypothetical protein EB796_013687 [Bugula neritina]
MSRRLEDSLRLYSNRGLRPASQPSVSLHIASPGVHSNRWSSVLSAPNNLPTSQHRVSAMVPQSEQTATPLSASNYSAIPAHNSSGLPSAAVGSRDVNTQNSGHDYNGARPRIPRVQRSITSPDNLTSIGQKNDALTSLQSHDDSVASGSTTRRSSLIKGLDSLLKATRKRLNRKSKRGPDPKEIKAGSSEVSQTTCVQPVGTRATLTTSIVVPPMNMGPPSGVMKTEWTELPHIRAHTTVDYLHYLVPQLIKVTNCGFYWGIMDRYEAESLLENKPEGTFLLRDSSQDDFIFSVSFRRYGRSLHARVEQWNHLFSFDAHDSGVFKAKSITALLEHYKDPQTCMFFEPMLTRPLNRPNPFSLLHLARAVVCDSIDYDSIDNLAIPRNLQEYLRYYHYKQKVRVRRHSNITQARVQH